MDLFLPWWTCNSEKLNCVVCMVVCCSVHHGLNALWEEEAVVEGVHRSEERRVGKECLRLCRSRWSPDH